MLDKNTKAGSGDGFLKNLQQLQNPTSSSSPNYQGPAPMEVDQVQFGKGKNKSKESRRARKEQGSTFLLEESPGTTRATPTARVRASLKERMAIRERTRARTTTRQGL